MIDYAAIIEAMDKRTLAAFKAFSDTFADGMAKALAERDALIEAQAKRIQALENQREADWSGVEGRTAALAESIDAAAEATQKQVREAVAAAMKALPGVAYRGVYDPDAEYARGDMVTHDGSVWHCNDPVSGEKPGGTKAFTLAVKRGRDGRDAKDSKGAE